jgi:hypothetical protein
VNPVYSKFHLHAQTVVTELWGMEGIFDLRLPGSLLSSFIFPSFKLACEQLFHSADNLKPEGR